MVQTKSSSVERQREKHRLPLKVHYRTAFGVCVGIALLILFVYGKVVWFEFVSFDDDRYVYKNPHVTTGLSVANARWAFSIYSSSWWIPLTWISHQFTWQIFGSSAGGHHFFNILLHVTSSLLLLGVLYRMTAAFLTSALVATLFAIHPLHVESVAWVTERKDVLCGLFWMLTLWAYWSYVSRGGWVRYFVVCAANGLAVMAKPLAVTLPCVLLLIDFWPLGRFDFGQRVPRPIRDYVSLRPVRIIFAEKLPLALCSGIGLCLSVLSQSGEGLFSAEAQSSLGLRLENAVFSHVAYLRKAAWPVDLACFYPRPETFAVWQLALATGFLTSVTAIAFWQARRRPYLVVGWLWFVGVMLPMSGLVRVGLQAMADRFTYLPMVGIYILVAWGISELADHWHLSRYVMNSTCGIVLAALMTATWFQIGYWRNTATLYGHAINVTGDNYLILVNRGAIYQNSGRHELAFQDFTQAIDINPSIADAYYNRGNSCLSLRNLDLALADYGRAIELNPEHAAAHANRGKVYIELGEVRRALADFSVAIDNRPDYALAYHNRGIAHLAMGNDKLAMADFGRAIELNPNFVDAWDNRGHLNSQLGQYDSAVRDYTKVIELKPKLASGFNNRAMAYAAMGSHDVAIDDFDKAIQLGPTLAEPYNNRGLSHAKLQRHDLAIDDYTKAIRLKPDFVNAFYNRGRSHGMQQHFPQAIADFTAVVSVAPDHAKSYYNRGLAYVYSNKHDAAVRDFTKAIDLVPDWVEAYNNRGFALAQLGQHAQAIEDFTRVITLRPRYKRAYRLRAVSFYENSEISHARKDVETLRALGDTPDPDLVKKLREAAPK